MKLTDGLKPVRGKISGMYYVCVDLLLDCGAHVLNTLSGQDLPVLAEHHP